MRSGRDTFTGLFRDFDYYPITDSTGRVIGEDSFFSFVVDVKLNGDKRWRIVLDFIFFYG
jgi:hypothetical protein